MACLCHNVSRLASHFDEAQARDLVPQLNQHLLAIRTILSKSKTVSRHVHYNVTCNNQRAMKILAVQSVDMAPVDRVCQRYRNDPAGFWLASNDPAHNELRRRVASMAIFLSSRADDRAPVPSALVGFAREHKRSELRYAGKKYIKMARKLGGIGAVFCLPLEVPFSTYERYVGMDEEEIFTHLAELVPRHEDYAEIVRTLIGQCLSDPWLFPAYSGLFVDYPDVLPDSFKLSLIIHGLGDTGVPDVLFRGLSLPQRRWNENGEVKDRSSELSGISSELLQLLSNDNLLDRAADDGIVSKQTMSNGTFIWSNSTTQAEMLSTMLPPAMVETLAALGLKIICHACPPCYEGNTDWTPTAKGQVWKLLNRLLQQRQPDPALRCQVMDAILYFCERDSLDTRRQAVERAGQLLSKSMPYYLHASVVLFQSLLHRMDADIDKSEAVILAFWAGPQRPCCRRDQALKGRLYLSHMESLIQRYDDSVASTIYGWRGEPPLSTLEIDVTRRFQGLAGKFFQSIGDFAKSRDSLEEYLYLNPSEPISVRMRRPIVSRLADTYCELGDYAKASELVAAEVAVLSDAEKRSRPGRRLLLAAVEASIGLGQLDAAESTLAAVAEAEASGPDDVTDQLMHLRAVMASARVAHERSDFEGAVERWTLALDEHGRLEPLNQRYLFAPAAVHLSLAYALLSMGDEAGARRAWDAAAGILETVPCDFWIPGLFSQWVRKIVTSVHEGKGWPLRIMMPGRKPDVTWP